MTQGLPGVNETQLDDLLAGGDINTMEQSFAELNAQQLQARALAENPALRGPTELQKIDARVAQRQKEWERHGLTAGAKAAIVQGGRGVIDAILAPGSLVGLAAEGLGTATGQEWLRDFGRELGEASSGKSAIELAAEIFHQPKTGPAPGQTQESPAQQVARKMEQQERDWPMLSTLARLAGQASVAVAGGLASTGNVGARALAGIAAAEGAAGGAQAAFEDGAPLRDVVASTILGMTIGGAAGYAGGRIASRAREAGPTAKDIAKAFGGEAKRVGKNAFATVEEAGGVQAKRVIDAIGGAKAKVAKAVRDAGPNPIAREAAEAAAGREVAEKMSQEVAGDVADWARREPDALKKFARRTDYLDQISRDLSEDFALAKNARPSLDFELNPKRVAKAMGDDVDAPLAIGRIQERISSAITNAPVASDEGAALSVRLRDELVALERVGRPATSRVAKRSNAAAYKQGAADAMVRTHALLKEVTAIAQNSTDESTRIFASGLADELLEDLGSEAFGRAGQLYRQSHVADDLLKDLDSPKALRERLRKLEVQGELLEEVSTRNKQWQMALDARRQLTGTKAETTELFKTLEKRVSAAEAVLTLDGKSTSRVLDILGTRAGSGIGKATSWVAKEAGADAIGISLADRMIGMAVGGSLGGAPGMALGFMVSNYIAPHINRVLRPVMQRTGEIVGRQAARFTAAKTTEAAGNFLGTAHISTGHTLYNRGVKDEEARRKPRTNQERQEQYKDRVNALAEYDSDMSHERVAEAMTYFHDVSPDTLGAVAAGMNERIQRLMVDLPKPTPHLGGPAYEVLSMQDLQKSEALWEATMEPMSIFEDFERGTVNYTKVQYVWKQYPGIQMAVQAAVTDVLMSQMEDQQRAYLPPQYLAQLDYLTGAQGTLQKTLDRGFSARMSQAFEEQRQQQQQAPSPPMSASPLAKHKQTYREKLLGH